MAEKFDRAILTGLYRETFPAVAAFIARRSGSLDEAKDIFQDAVLIWYEKKRDPQCARVTRDDRAYIMGTAKHLWHKRFSTLGSLGTLDGIDLPDLPERDSPSEKRLMHYLETAGKKCMELLRGFYFDKSSLDEIAQHFGFSGVRSATVQKYKCLEKVRETVKQKSLQYEDFLD